MVFPPQGFIIGAQKAGTTSLASMLDLQPGIAVSNPKETQFFTRNWERGPDWYRQCFPEKEASLFLDASPDYSAAPTAAFPDEVHAGDPRKHTVGRIAELSPDARFIYVLREPATRVYSAYWQAYRSGFVTLPFREAIAKNLAFIRASDYAGQLRNYLECFPLEHFLLVDFMELKRAPEAVLRRCCDFLGVAFDPAALPEDDVRKNQSYQLSPAAKLLHRLSGSNANFKRLSRRVKSAVPAPVGEQLKKLMTRDIPPMSAEDRAYLQELLLPCNEDLHSLTGFDVSAWAPPEGSQRASSA